MPTSFTSPPADGHVGPIRRLLWVRGDDTLLSCSDDAKIKVGGRGDVCAVERTTQRHDPPVADSAVLHSLHRHFLFAALQVWQIAGAGMSGKLVRVLHGHAGAVNDIHFKCAAAARGEKARRR